MLVMTAFEYPHKGMEPSERQQRRSALALGMLIILAMAVLILIVQWLQPYLTF